ncbi:hypothetical protein MVES1_000770 [Malassezia vespertilionis]|uniref:Uncharacterized protein n=1 Tax=Malassezia vespertilionis TaxID=2020962 RepID=A0A2N1JG35_9BASI|nr:uncharacterized protein MVES1_000770 [Malassezia vespertilionis]PKI85499.1 hypothetical protein MVES_000729 [Malassezia vespertilionis]WFD05440.1 hypothetical protein MVES1_000770 [Malassezia vespertilionis]
MTDGSRGEKREWTHEARAASLLKRVRASAIKEKHARKEAVHIDEANDTLPLPRLIHALHTLASLSVVEAMAVVRALSRAQCTTRSRLRLVSAPELEAIGVQCSAAARDRIVQVLHTLGASSAEEEMGGLTSVERERQLEKQREMEHVQRAWGDRHTPSLAQTCEAENEFAFNPVTDSSALHGKFVLVNRAPVMTAWAVVVLQCMGFAADEALSIAQCYVSSTAHARAQALRRAPTETRPKHVVSESQPHIVFMGVTIPVICLRDGRYRGMHSGEVVPPARAFAYLKKSMYQTLPQVMGAMLLLARSYVDMERDTEQHQDAARLHSAAYGLYTEFRPETHGEWGKRATLSLDTILALRRGMDKGEEHGEVQQRDQEPANGHAESTQHSTATHSLGATDASDIEGPSKQEQ